MIIQSILEGNNVVVDAVAGSGKTTTILELAKVCKEVKILLLTYNTRLKNECRGKVEDAGLKNVEVHSYHSLCLKYYTDYCRSDSDIQKAITDRMPRKTDATHQLIFVDETQDMNSFHFSLLKKFISDQDLSTQYGVFGDSC
jgi:superfamily I DNA/RNA helicase